MEVTPELRRSAWGVAWCGYRLKLGIFWPMTAPGIHGGLGYKLLSRRGPRNTTAPITNAPSSTCAAMCNHVPKIRPDGLVIVKQSSAAQAVDNLALGVHDLKLWWDGGDKKVPDRLGVVDLASQVSQTEAPNVIVLEDVLANTVEIVFDLRLFHIISVQFTQKAEKLPSGLRSARESQAQRAPKVSLFGPRPCSLAPSDADTVSTCSGSGQVRGIPWTHG